VIDLDLCRFAAKSTAANADGDTAAADAIVVSQGNERKPY
jgi:hypothetical protein